jgi:CRP-like cAMP-binding protein
MSDDLLRRVSREMFFAAFGPLGEVGGWLVERVSAVLDERTVRAGATIYVEGDPPGTLHFMREGRVRMTREGGPTWTLQGRWVLGTYEGIADRPRVTTAVAETDLHLLSVPTSVWLDLLEDSFELTRSSILAAARTVAALEGRLASGPPSAEPVAPRVRGALSLVEKIAFMLEVKMLRGAGVQVLVDLATTTEENTFEAGQVVLERGQERDRLVFVMDGEVRADRSAPDLTHTYGHGQLVCGAAAFGQWSSPWRAVASTPTRALSLPIDAWFDTMEEHFDLARSVLVALSARRQLVVEQLAREVKDLVLG